MRIIRNSTMAKALILLLTAAMLLFVSAAAFADDGNEPNQFGGQIQIIDAQTGKKIGISGAEYQVSDSTGKVMGTVKTNATGSIYLNSKFTDGSTYIIKALTAPKGYALDSSRRSFTVSFAAARHMNGQLTFVFEIREQPIRCRIQQVDMNGDPIKEAGSIFTIYDRDGKLYDTVVTNSEGIADLHKNIPYGSYMLKATKAPTGYYLNRGTVNFTVADSTIVTLTNGSKLCTVTIRDEIIQGRLVSTDEKSTNVIEQANSTYEIYDSEGRLFDTVTTNDKGVAEFHLKVPYGRYTAIVTKAPDKFYKDPEPFSFEVLESDIKSENGGRLFEVKYPHSPILPSVYVRSTGDVLVDVTEVEENGFTVYKPVYDVAPLYGTAYKFTADQDIYLNKKVVIKNGEIAANLTVTDKTNTVDKLNIGRYVISETQTPYGYEPASNYQAYVMQGDQEKLHPIQVVSFKHDLRETSITFTVNAEAMTIDSRDGQVRAQCSMHGAEGFCYGLYTAEEIDMLKKAEIVNTQDHYEPLSPDTLVATAVSDKDGSVVFKGVFPIGKYYVIELVAPDQFVPKTDLKMELTNAENTKKSGVIEIKLENVDHALRVAPVTVSAATPEGDPITGATIEIRNSDGEVVHVSRTNGSGLLENVMLLPGAYEARELEAGDTYELNDEVVTFTVSDTEESQPVVLVSMPVKYEMRVVDEKGDPQRGVTFGIFQGDVEYASALSDENGVVTFVGLPKGSYQIRMITPANGYKKSETTVDIEVTDIWRNTTTVESHSAEPESSPEHEDETNPDKKSGKSEGKTWIWIAGVAAVVCIAAAGVIVSGKGKAKKAAAAESAQPKAQETAGTDAGN